MSAAVWPDHLLSLDDWAALPGIRSPPDGGGRVPGSVRTDRVVKFAEYADAGVPDYWIVDLDNPVSLAAHRLKGSRYVHVGEGADVLRLDSPAPLSIDPTALRTPRRDS